MQSAPAQARHSTGTAPCPDGEVRALPGSPPQWFPGGRLLEDPFPPFPGVCVHTQSVSETQRSGGEEGAAGVRPSDGPWVWDFSSVAIGMCVLTRPRPLWPGQLSSWQRGEGPGGWERAGQLLHQLSARKEEPSQETPVQAPALNKARGAKAVAALRPGPRRLRAGSSRAGSRRRLSPRGVAEESLSQRVAQQKAVPR